MPVDPNKMKFAYAYTNDDGVSSNIILNAADATAAGFPPGIAGAGNWGALKGRNKVRMLHGVNSDGTKRRSLPMPSLSAYLSKFATGTFVIAGVDTFLITGRSGEHITVGKGAL